VTVTPVVVAFGAFVATLVGGLAALRFRDQQHLILGLSAGLMLGVVGFDLVPEALSQQPGELFGVPSVMLAAALGFLTLHIVERSLAIHRGHEGEEGEYAGHVHAPGLGLFAASALVVHSLLDGLATGNLRHPSRGPRPPSKPPHLGLHGPRRRRHVAGHRPRQLSQLAVDAAADRPARSGDADEVVDVARSNLRNCHDPDDLPACKGSGVQVDGGRLR
jgi:hypothetical protein